MAPTALNVYNVMSYGALGNGTTNDATAINNAISDIVASRLLGGILYFPPSTGGYLVGLTTCIAVPYGITVAGVAGFGFFTQSKLMVPAQTVIGSNPPAGLVLAPNASGILSNTAGYIFDGAPGRQIGGTNLAPAGFYNFSANVLRGANLGDWLLFSNTNYNVPQPPSGIWYQCIVNWSDDDLTTPQPSDFIAPLTNANQTIDPYAIMLENGHIVCAFTTQTGSGNTFQQFIQSWLSTDGGRTWTFQSSIPVQTNAQGVAIQSFSEPYIIRLRQRGTGAPNVLVMVFCDNDPAGVRTTVYRTSWSGDEGHTWAAPTQVTPSSGAGCAGMISDATRAWIIEDGNSNTQVFYSSQFPNQPASLWQVQCNPFGGAPGTPSEIIASAPLSQRAQCLGLFPAVMRLRTYEYALYYTTGINQTSQIHFLTSPTAVPGTWSTSADRMLYQVTGITCGFGRISPVRKYTDGIELIHQYNCQPRSIFHYGV
jgi:hypothetical protein